jgi:ABC-2 type transport system ATP-binding protein
MFGSFYRERETPQALLERFALGEKADAPFDTLSGGQRQRLALALAFVNRPAVVLLDEPTTGLDPLSRRDLHRQIAGMKRDGYTVLLTTHYLEEAGQLCDRIAIIDAGRIVATGAPRDLIAHSGSLQSVTLVTSPPLAPADLARVPGVQEPQCDGGSTRFRTNDATVTLAALLALLQERRVELIDLQVRKASLEEVFFRLTRAENQGASLSP